MVGEIYKTMSFSSFINYSTFYNFGAFLTFLYLLLNLFYPLLPYFYAPFCALLVLTLVICCLGIIESDYNFRATIGFLSTGSITLSLLFFSSLAKNFDFLR
jgi:hypothetical protein